VILTHLSTISVIDKISGHTFRPHLELPGPDQAEIEDILKKMNDFLQKHPVDPNDGCPLMFNKSVEFWKILFKIGNPNLRMKIFEKDYKVSSSCWAPNSVDKKLG